MSSSPFRDYILLLKLRISKDPEAFGKLYDRYVDRVYRFIYFKVSHEEHAQDLTSDVFLKAWEYIAEHPIENFNAFIFNVARNTIIDFYRKQGRALTVNFDEAIQVTQEEYDGEDTHDALTKKEDVTLIQRCLPLLKEEYREIIVLRFIEELDISEIAATLQIKKGNVRVLIHRAIKALKREVEKTRNT